MWFATIKSLTRTWRFRLTAWSALLVVVTALVTLIGLREGVRLTLLAELDRLLIEDVREIDLSIKELDYPRSDALYDELDRKARGHAQHGWFVQLIRRDGKVVWSSPNAPTGPLEKPHLTELLPFSLGTHRFVEHWPAHRGTDGIGLRVGASLESLQTDLARIDRLVVMVAALVLIAAPLGGYWLATRVRKPWAEMVKTTERLRPARLDERLPVRHTGDELDQLSLAFNRLLDRIARYLEQKNDFLANAAHELRTPLAAIRSTIEVTLSGKRSLQEYEQLLSEVLEEGAALELLVNQLLLLAETETDWLRIHGDRVPFDEIVGGALEMFRGVAEFRNIQLDSSPLPPVQIEGNRYHLRQVLNNLLDNALKFTPPGGRVQVALEVAPDQSTVELRVADSGHGIAPADLPYVFDRFFRGDRSRRRDTDARGTGLGLSICQAIVVAHGGQIQATSELDQGTKFIVTLPVSQAPTSDSHPPLDESGLLGPRGA